MVLVEEWGIGILKEIFLGKIPRLEDHMTYKVLSEWSRSHLVRMECNDQKMALLCSRTGQRRTWQRAQLMLKGAD